jgi:chromosome partitioning protein
MPRAKIVSVINYKGGVGKTTTTYHIGCSLAQHFGKQVLLVDIDPQTNLTFLCAPVEEWQKFKSRAGTIKTMYDRFQAKQTLDTKRFIWRSPITLVTTWRRHHIDNVDLIPCDIDLLGEDLGGGQVTGTFPTLEALRRQAGEYLRERMFLVRALQEVESDYDYILIDCPPNIYLMTQNALLASHQFVITTIPDHLSTIGLRILQGKVDKISEMIAAAHTFAGGSGTPRPIATLGGVIFVRVRIGGGMLVNAHTQTMAAVRGMLGEQVCFPTSTTELIGYGEAAAVSLPVWMHDSPNARRAAAKQEYQRIAREFLERIG